MGYPFAMDAGVMATGEIGGLVNSLTRFIHLVACQTARNAPIVKYLSKAVTALKLLKPVLDGVMHSSLYMVGFSEEITGLFEELDALVAEAREIVEKHAHRMSRTCNVLQCEPLEIKILNSSIEICRIFGESLQPDPPTQLYSSIERCIQGLDCCNQGSTLSQAIERCLKDQREYSIFSPEDMIIVAESLGLTSKEQLLRERIALEKEKARMEAQSARSPQGVYTGLVIEELIMLLREIGSCLEKKEKQDCAIPLYFRCPLSSELMLDPVILASGQTFERGFIQRWLDSGLRICPVTRQALPHTNLVPNFTVKALIMNWCEEKGVSLGHSPLSNILTSEVSSYLGGECPALGDCVQASTKIGTEEGSGCKASFLQKDDPLLYGHSRSESASSANSALDVTGRSISDEKAAATRGAAVAPPYSSPWSLGTCYSSSHGEDDGGRTPSCSTGCGGWDELADYSLMEQLVDDLQSREDFSSSDDREARRAAAASELRLMSKNSRENRLLIGRCGGIPPFVALLQNLGNKQGEAEGNGHYKEMEENAVTALLNLSIEETNKRAVVQAGGVEPLVQVLRYGRSAAARENAAAALASLGALEEHKTSIGRCVGAIRGLVELLGQPNGTVRGKKDAAMALFSLSIAQENKARIVQAGATRHLLEFLADGGQDEGGGGMVDKAAALLANLATIDEGRAAIVQEGGIPLLVEVVEMGSHKGKENAAAALLQLCMSSQTRCALVLEEGAVPPLITLSQLGTPRAREKAQQILSQFRCQRQASDFGRRRP